MDVIEPVSPVNSGSNGSPVSPGTARRKFTLMNLMDKMKQQTCCIFIPIRPGLVLCCIFYIGISFVDVFAGPVKGNWFIWTVSIIDIILSIYALYGIWKYKTRPLRAFFWFLVIYTFFLIGFIIYELIEWNKLCSHERGNIDILHTCKSETWKALFLLSRIIEILITMYFAKLFDKFTQIVYQLYIEYYKTIY